MPRDSNGNMTLVAGNPVVTDTTISSSWANTTLADLASEIQDSLSRSGKGGMLVSFNFANGTVANPGITFTNDTSTGLRLNAAGDMRFVVSGADAIKIIGSAITLLGNVTFSQAVSALTISGILTLAAGTMTSSVADAANAVAFTLNTSNTLSTASTSLLKIQNNGTTKLTLAYQGLLTVPGVSTTGVGGGTPWAFAYATYSGASPWTLQNATNVTQITQAGGVTTMYFAANAPTANLIALSQFSSGNPVDANVWTVEDSGSGSRAVSGMAWTIKKAGAATAPPAGSAISLMVFQ